MKFVVWNKCTCVRGLGWNLHYSVSKLQPNTKNHPDTNMNSIWFVNICWLRIRISLFGPNYSNTIRIPNYLLTSDMCDISLRLLDLLSVKFKWVYLQVGPKIPSAGALKTVERHFAKDMKAGKKHAMQHPLQFRAIHVNNCFLFQWKCTAGSGNISCR